MAKVTETVKRLLALEHGLAAVEGEVRGLREELHEEVSELRADLNRGVGALLAGLERLEGAIGRVAEIRPRLDSLEARVTKLEGHA